ncbi:MAG: hypothetical protein ACOH1T_07125 [Microbacteriaceae bacterium]
MEQFSGFGWKTFALTAVFLTAQKEFIALLGVILRLQNISTSFDVVRRLRGRQTTN